MNIADVVPAFNKVVDLLGVPAVFSRAKVPGVTINIAHVGFAGISREDQALVNAYGFSAKVITVKVADITGDAPDKFDVLHVNAERYTVDTVIPIHAPGTGALIGWRLVCKGK